MLLSFFFRANQPVPSRVSRWSGPESFLDVSTGAFLPATWQEGGEGEVTRRFQGYTSLLSLSSVLLLVVHSFRWSSSLKRNFFFKKKDCLGIFFFPSYILNLQNRNYFILIVYYSSTLVEAQKKNYASLNSSNYRNIYVTLMLQKNKSICVRVYIIYICIYIYTHTILCFPVECIFMRF